MIEMIMMILLKLLFMELDGLQEIYRGKLEQKLVKQNKTHD